MQQSVLPTTALDFMEWEWSQIEPFYQELEQRSLTTQTVAGWLGDWSRLWDLIEERGHRLQVTRTLNTLDEDAAARFQTFLGEIYEPAKAAQNRLIEKLLASGLEPAGFEVPMRRLRADADLFRAENLPLLTEEQKLGMVYDRLIGQQTVQWEGREVTLTQLVPLVQDADRDTRELAWRLASDRVLADRDALNENWTKLMDVRKQMARNAGKPDFRAYAWQNRHRFDYAPDDALRFHTAIEEVVVPAAARVYERRRQDLRVASLRPWDISVDVMRNTDLTGDPKGRPAIRAFETVEELEEKAANVFRHVDPALGEYYETMRREKLLNLPNYKGKAPGAYCMTYPASKRPFVFLNAVGTASNVDTMLHECGHAFHVFERTALDYWVQRESPMEFNEVASMAMELLGTPYLTRSQGGFYSEQDSARAMIEHLEGMLVFWPYMAVVDAFQHWVYTHHDEATRPAACDRMWGQLWDRFIQGPDWSGLDDQKVTGWHRKLHIHRVPFYYIEYGLASLGASQIWRNALRDQAEAVRQYRRALALGGTATLPELYAAAGAKLAFDADTFRAVVDLMEETIDRLSTA